MKQIVRLILTKKKRILSNVTAFMNRNSNYIDEKSPVFRNIMQILTTAIAEPQTYFYTQNIKSRGSLIKVARPLDNEKANIRQKSEKRDRVKSLPSKHLQKNYTLSLLEDNFLRHQISLLQRGDDRFNAMNLYIVPFFIHNGQKELLAYYCRKKNTLFLFLNSLERKTSNQILLDYQKKHLQKLRKNWTGESQTIMRDILESEIFTHNMDKPLVWLQERLEDISTVSADEKRQPKEGICNENSYIPFYVLPESKGKWPLLHEFSISFLKEFLKDKYFELEQENEETLL